MLLYHVLQGKLTAAKLVELHSVKTLNGQSLKIRVTSERKTPMKTPTPHPYTTADSTPRAPRRFHAAITTRNLRQGIALRARASSFLSLHHATEKLRRFRRMPACLSAASGPLQAGR